MPRYYDMNPSLTPEEKAVLASLTLAWNSFLNLPRSPSDTLDDASDFRQAIHRAEDLIAVRVARRLEPDIWK